MHLFQTMNDKQWSEKDDRLRRMESSAFRLEHRDFERLIIAGCRKPQKGGCEAANRIQSFLFVRLLQFIRKKQQLKPIAFN